MTDDQQTQSIIRLGESGRPVVDKDAYYGQGRLPGHVYASKSFPMDRRHSQDFGQPSRFVYKVSDRDEMSELVLDGEEYLLRSTPAGRVQVKVMVTRQSGNVKELWVQRISGGKSETLMNFDRAQLDQFLELIDSLQYIPIEGETSVRVEDSLIRAVFTDPSSLARVYDQDPERFRELISDDVAARDVIAVAYRREQVEKFKNLLNAPTYFADEMKRLSTTKKETVWQKYFESNPWIFGLNLSGQFFTSFDKEKLEQTVSGGSIGSTEKRADAVMRTAGRVRSLIFAEIKHHETELLKADHYRSGCWTPTLELAGGVAQSHGTVYRAMQQLGERLPEKDDDGNEIPGLWNYMIRPRSYLIIGQLEELMGERGGVHADKFRSFEMYRRNLVEPEVITFDELYARAEWLVEAQHGET